ncbi:MAG: ATP synthase F1 subunit epsilon [Flavobacteriales bacterium]|nr:ATP synthase F1 subunit epsilon [Flavobacteriales bacterium]
MQLEIITPDKSIFSGEATSVTLPGADGSLGILDNHAALISTLQSGELRVTDDKGVETVYELKGGGVAEVQNNKLIILAESI